MTRLSLAITDFAVPGDGDAPVPRLPSLERLLARGEQSLPSVAGWRHWVLAQAGMQADRNLPVAATIAGRPGHWALATPVHLVAGLEHLHIDPAGLPALSPPEQQVLADSFNRMFGPDGLELSFEDGAALLRMPAPFMAATHDPEVLAGREAGAWLPSGPDGAKLRKLMTEFQMWLHDHPLTAARESRGDIPVNALWIWGEGGEALSPTSPALPRLASGDAFLRALWRRADAEAAGTPPALEPWLETMSGEHALATLGIGQVDDAGTHAEALERIEARWFAPLVDALGDASLSEVRLFLAGRELVVRPQDRIRFWRRRRAWTEALG
ncbi:MAG: hypothetical protein AMJ58_05650 [Gammaproteobacteria bacterium SG8_30]|nr:MAG: hypothetical protein AMJ58_05650 [Gammaproteobacteria bacterium SG8_30]